MARHVSAVLDALGLKRVDLLGFSLGGFVAQQVALESPHLIRRVILAGTGPQGGEGMDKFTPKVTEHATREKPILEDFLYLFFSQSETSQAAGRAFWERRHTRLDQDVPSSVAAMGAQGNAIAAWGIVPQLDRYASLRRIKHPVLVVNGPTTSWCPRSTPSSCSRESRTRPSSSTPTRAMARSFNTRSYLSLTRACSSRASDVAINSIRRSFTVATCSDAHISRQRSAQSEPAAAPGGRHQGRSRPGRTPGRSPCPRAFVISSGRVGEKPHLGRVSDVLG